MIDPKWPNLPNPGSWPVRRGHAEAFQWSQDKRGSQLCPAIASERRAFSLSLPLPPCKSPAIWRRSHRDLPTLSPSRFGHPARLGNALASFLIPLSSLASGLRPPGLPYVSRFCRATCKLQRSVRRIESESYRDRVVHCTRCMWAT